LLKETFGDLRTAEGQRKVGKEGLSNASNATYHKFEVQKGRPFAEFPEQRLGIVLLPTRWAPERVHQIQDVRTAIRHVRWAEEQHAIVNPIAEHHGSWAWQKRSMAIKSGVKGGTHEDNEILMGGRRVSSPVFETCSTKPGSDTDRSPQP